MRDEKYMRRALALAKKGVGFVNPNPMVGAVIVKNDTIIGEGYHERFGELHAERNAFASLTQLAEQAELYVTLEPCCHYGKTPPCTEAIIEHGIRRVVIGSRDPNPLVAGKGTKILRDHGIEVVEDVLREECDAINQIFFHYISKKTPYVLMKYAQTLDGKIACHTGKSKWVTGQAARDYVQELRHRYMGIMVGVNTVLEDNPMLTCRMAGGKNPIRIVCDSKLRTPMDSNLVRTAAEIPTIIATICKDEKKILPYQQEGCEVICTKSRDGRVDLVDLMRLLGERKIDSILLEGGASLNWSALEAGIVCEAAVFIAPKLFGGREAKTAVAGAGVDCPDEAFMLKGMQMRQFGEDILLTGKIEKKLEKGGENICSQES